MISVSNLRSGYAEGDVLHSIDVDISAGEMVGVLGPNGSGKSTFLLTLSGVLRAKSGTVLVDSLDVSSVRPKDLARRVAVVPQKLEAVSGLTVAELVMMGRYPYSSFATGRSAADEECVAQSMDACGVDSLKHRSLDCLSGGELQRAYIARALAQDTDILLLDEAASGLDIGRKIEIYDLLRNLNKQGKTIVTVVHDVNMAAMYCPRLLFFQQGKIVLDGKPADVLTAENIGQIYETGVQVIPHPVSGVPQVLLHAGGLPADSE
ncbi:MAG: ABC transporter ATP-binding protein [Desulfovibrio sp.]